MGTATRRLKEARHTRAHIAGAFRQLEQGSVPLETVIKESSNSGVNIPAFRLRTVDLWDVLRRAPHLGRAGAKKVCETSDVWPHTRMGELTDEQRRAIIDALPPRARKTS